MQLKKIEYFSSKRFTIDWIIGCVFTGVSQEGCADSIAYGNTRRMQVRCVKGPMMGTKFWLDWSTEVSMLD